MCRIIFLARATSMLPAAPKDAATSTAFFMASSMPRCMASCRESPKDERFLGA